MKNGLDEQYIDLLKDILENGVNKNTRNGEVLSVFGRTIRYKFKDGKFPLLTTKKMYFKGIVTELLWFLRGNTDIRFLWENNCHIWDGDWWKDKKETISNHEGTQTLETFLTKWKGNRTTNKDEWFDLGPIYGNQWRKWRKFHYDNYDEDRGISTDIECNITYIDQIANLINDLKTNPDSRRLMVNAWNVGELGQMVLPPCHYGFQVYTRELSDEEMIRIVEERVKNHQPFKDEDLPKRAISLMWNQRSVDTFLGLPFNIASYGLLLEIIAKEVNMVPDELIGNLGDVHLYKNHIEQAKEQLTRDSFELPSLDKMPDYLCEEENWECYEPSDIKLINYKSQPPIKAPLSN